MPKIFGAKNLSADEISAALQGGTTTGTSTALVATVPGSPSLSDGLLVMVELHTATGSFPTLNLNSLGAKLLYKGTQSGVTGLASGQLPQFSKALLMFSTTLDGWFVLSSLKSVAADIPSTLNATTFAGVVTINHPDIQLNIIRGYSDSGTMTVEQGQSAGGAHLKLYGLNHPTKPSRMEYILRNASGAAHSFFDKNGVEQLKIDENGAGGATYGELFFSGGVGVRIRWNYGASPQALLMDATGIFLGNTTHGGLYCYRTDYATYPGAHQQFAPLSTRAASTAFAVCPVATGDIADIWLYDNDSGAFSRANIYVDSTGAITTGDGGISAKYVESSSPAAAEIGIYISAGVFYCKPGSSFTGKIATFSKIGKA